MPAKTIEIYCNQCAGLTEHRVRGVARIGSDRSDEFQWDRTSELVHPPASSFRGAARRVMSGVVGRVVGWLGDAPHAYG
jgi:ribosomal protein L44E